MALVSKGFYCNVKIKDAAGNQSTLKYDIVAIDLLTAKSNASTIVAALAAVTAGVIVSYTVGERIEEDALFYGSAGSEVENLALIVSQLEATAGTPVKYHTSRIPAPLDIIFQGVQGPSRNQVNLSNPALVAYMELFTNKTTYAVPGADAIALVSDGEKIAPSTAADVPSLNSGKRIHRRSRLG